MPAKIMPTGEFVGPNVELRRSIKGELHRIVTLMKVGGIYNDFLFSFSRNRNQRKRYFSSSLIHFLYCFSVSSLMWLNAIRVMYDISETQGTGLSTAFVSTLTNSVLYALFGYITTASLWTLSREFKPLIDKILIYEQKYGWVFNERRVKKIFKFGLLAALGCWIGGSVSFMIIIDRSNKSLPVMKSFLSLKLFGIADMELIHLKMAWVSVILLFTGFINYISLGTYCLFVYILFAEAKGITDMLKKRNEVGDSPHDYIRHAKSRLEEIFNLVWSFDSCMRHYIATLYGGTVTIICMTIYTNTQGTLTIAESLILITYLGLMVFNISITAVTAVSLSKKIHEPLNVLHQMDMSRFSEKDLQEVSIFISRLSGQPLGITVYGLFVLDQSSILAILGTILTYAIVMLQFKPSHDSGQENQVLLNLILEKLNTTNI